MQRIVRVLGDSTSEHVFHDILSVPRDIRTSDPLHSSRCPQCVAVPCVARSSKETTESVQGEQEVRM